MSHHHKHNETVTFLWRKYLRTLDYYDIYILQNVQVDSYEQVHDIDILLKHGFQLEHDVIHIGNVPTLREGTEKQWDWFFIVHKHDFLKMVDMQRVHPKLRTWHSLYNHEYPEMVRIYYPIYPHHGTDAM
jgi:hypothetical protein